MKFIKKKLIFILMLSISLTFIFTFEITSFANNNNSNTINNLNINEINNLNTNTNSNLNSTNLNTYSPSIILMESSTGKVIYEKNGYRQMPPASTTKIMTAILTLENCSLSDVATASANAVNSVPVGYSHAYIKAGEELTINQLLHALLIPSANDAANIIAEHIAGSISSFCTMMNAKAEELGCLNTHFVNANGITADSHYSTAYDLAIMARYAMQNEIFRQIVSTTSYTLPATNKYAEANRTFKNTNILLHVDNRDAIDNYYYEYATGIKTGYTAAAKDCIVASAKKDNLEYIAVILGADKTDNGLSARYIDCKTLFEYAFENFTTFDMHKSGDILKQVKVKTSSGFSKNLDVIIENNITFALKKDTNISNVIPTIDIQNDLIAPISENTTIGTITYNVDGNTYTSKLLAGKNIEDTSILSTALSTLFGVLIVFILIKLVSKKHKHYNRKRKHH